MQPVKQLLLCLFSIVNNCKVGTHVGVNFQTFLTFRRMLNIVFFESNPCDIFLYSFIHVLFANGAVIIKHVDSRTVFCMSEMGTC